MQPWRSSTSRARCSHSRMIAFSRGRPRASRIAGMKTSCRKRRSYSSTTAHCSASREPTRENTPLLDRPSRLATSPIVRLSSPSAAAICRATSTMAANVRPLRSVRVSMETQFSTVVRTVQPMSTLRLGGQSTRSRRAMAAAPRMPASLPVAASFHPRARKEIRPREVGEIAAQRREQRFAGFRNAAADKARLQVERVDQGSQALGDAPAGRLDRAARRLLADAARAKMSSGGSRDGPPCR